MSIMISGDNASSALLKAIGAPDNCLSVGIFIRDGDPVLVECEYLPENIELDEDGEPFTILKKYQLTEIEDDGS